MSLTRAFKKLQEANPSWNYKQLAYELKTADNVLRGINARLKLPIPVRAKSPDGQSKRRIASDVHKKFTPAKKKASARMIVIPQQMGSGRSQYSSYLKLL